MTKETLEVKVREMLHNDEASRNSDITLTLKIWRKYYSDIVFRARDGKWYVELLKLFDLPREDNIKRIRAKIQNVEHLYLPTSPAVAKKRGWAIDEWREYLGYPRSDKLK